MLKMYKPVAQEGYLVTYDGHRHSGSVVLEATTEVRIIRQSDMTTTFAGPASDIDCSNPPEGLLMVRL